MIYNFEAYSIAGITILLAGLLRLYVYYKGFKFSILPFLEPGEIFTIFFDNLLYFLAFTVLNVLVISILYSEILGQINSLVYNDFWTRLNAYGFFKIYKLIVLLVLFVSLYWVYNKSKRMLLIKGFEINQLSIYFLIGSLNLFAFAGFSGVNETNKVKNHGYYKGTEFYFDGSDTFISDDKKYYIGKTKQFIFFYDSDKKETFVIPISNIKKMKY